MDASKYLNGLRTRTELGKYILRREDFPDHLFSKQDDVSRNALISFFSESKAEELRLQICRVCVKFRSVPEQQRFLGQFRDHPIVTSTTRLTIGALFDSRKTIQEELCEEGSSGDCDYSITATNEVVTSTPATEQLLRSSHSIVKNMMQACGIAPAHNAASLSRYFAIFGVNQPDVRDLQRLASCFQQVKEHYWALFGPDVLSAFQALCDPLHHITVAQLAAIDQLAELWGLRAIFMKLCLVRALGAYENEQRFALKHLSGLKVTSLNHAIRGAAYAVLTDAPYEGYVRCTAGMDILSYLIAAFTNISLATRRRDLVVLKRQIADLYQRDPSAYLFLNWEAIHHTFELPAFEADVHTIFLKLLMLHPTIGKRFITVALARGKGHLVADLSSFIGRIRAEAITARKTPSIDRGNIQFIRLVRRLPASAAERLIEEVTDKGMMERLAFAFSSTIKLSPSALPKVDNQASILRLELANLALRYRALNERSANRIIEDETHFLRMHKFHTLFRAGRVKIDWDYLGSLIFDLIDENFAFLIPETTDRTIDRSVLDNVIRLVSEELSDILLFDSESSLEQALNNNVRHGVLVPRFVKEFNEALVAALDYTGHPGDLSDETYARFGKHSKQLLKLKEHVTNKVNAYKDYWLTVQRDGEFQTETREMIAQIMQSINAEIDSSKLSRAIIAEFKHRVERVLSDALGVLLDKVKPAVFEEISDCRVACSKSHSKNVTTFLDLLETRLQKAFEEISDWLGLAKITTDVPDFELIDLMRFEAVSLIFSDFKKLHFTHDSLFKKDGRMVPMTKEPRIRGAYFEVTQEIIHNLISNALKHSGLGMNTAINMSLRVDDSDLIFRCVNNFARKRFSAISAAADDVKRLIRNSHPSQGRKDSQSGFSKVKNVCSRVLFEEISINIPPVSERNLQYVVEIRIPNATAMMLA